MGSSGTGHLSDYSGRKKSGDGGGGASGEDLCDKAISATLEDVERSPYYKKQNAPPVKGTSVEVVFDRRPGVATTDGVLIGHLPTRYNYLKGCLDDGRTYRGTVVAVDKSAPVLVVTVDVAPV
jgi:hypothetical protein